MHYYVLNVVNNTCKYRKYNIALFGVIIGQIVIPFLLRTFAWGPHPT